MPSTRTTAESTTIVRDLLAQTSALRTRSSGLNDEYINLPSTSTGKEELSAARAEVFKQIVAIDAETDRLSVDLLSEFAALRRRSGSVVDMARCSKVAGIAAALMQFEGLSQVTVGGDIVVGFTTDEDTDFETFLCADLTTPEQVTLTTAKWNPEAGFKFQTFTGHPVNLDMLIGFAVDI